MNILPRVDVIIVHKSSSITHLGNLGTVWARHFFGFFFFVFVFCMKPAITSTHPPITTPQPSTQVLSGDLGRSVFFSPRENAFSCMSDPCEFHANPYVI